MNRIDNNKQFQLLKQKLNQEEVDLSNGLLKIESQQWEYFPKISRVEKVKVLHFQRNYNPYILAQIEHIQFSSLKRLILQSNKIVNMESILFIDLPCLQELDLLKNKIFNIHFLADSKLPNLKNLKMSIDTISHGWNDIFRSQTNLKFMLLESFYTKNNLITFSKLHNLSKSAFVNDLYFKTSQKKEPTRLMLYLKDFKAKKK